MEKQLFDKVSNVFQHFLESKEEPKKICVKVQNSLAMEKSFKKYWTQALIVCLLLFFFGSPLFHIAFLNMNPKIEVAIVKENIR